MSTTRNALRAPHASNLLELTTQEKLEKFRTSQQSVSNKIPDSCPVCEQEIWVSLFFDGTSQNINQDFPIKKLSNPAKLFVIANGSDPGVSGLSPQNRIKYRADAGQYAFYYSGVGTPYTEKITGGEPSFIEKWAKEASNVAFMGSSAAPIALEKMAASKLWSEIEDSTALGGGTGAGTDKRLDAAFRELNAAIQTNPKRKTLNIAIFGFSRGAAIGRIFCSRLVAKCKDPHADQLIYKDKTLNIRFMGLYDTVASFGLPAQNLLGDDLVIPKQVKKCVHMVAAHEFRLSFPIWSTRAAPSYDKFSYEEYVYPGVHTDVGGGYGPNNFGDVANHQYCDNDLAAMPLRHMYRKALAAGVPLASIEEVLTTDGYAAQFKAKPQALKIYNDYLNTALASGTLEHHANMNHRELCRWWGALDQENSAAQGSAVVAANAKFMPDWQREEGAYASPWIKREADMLKLRDTVAGKPADKSWYNVIKRNVAILNNASPLPTIAPAPLNQEQSFMLLAYRQANPSPATNKLFMNYLHDSVFGFGIMERYLFYRYFRLRGVHDGRW